MLVLFTLSTAGLNAQPAKLTVTSQLHVPFWLYVDDALQNEAPVRSITITNLPMGDHLVSVVLDDRDSHSFGQKIAVNHHSLTLAINRQGSYYGWETTFQYVHPELTQPFAPILSPMVSNHDFKDIKEALAAERYDNTRLALAKQIVAQNPLNAEQVAEICKMMSFESNRLDFAKYAYRYCVDPNRYYLVNATFSFDSSKRELDKFIQGQ